METRLIRHGGRHAAWLAPLLLCAVAVPAAAAETDTTGYAAAVTAAKADMLVDPVRALDDAMQAQRAAERSPPGRDRDLKRATALWLQGEARARNDEPKQALAPLTIARSIADREAAGSKLNADVMLALGGALTDSGDIAKALPTLQRAHSMFVQLDDPRSQSKTLILIATLYSRARDYAAALRYFGMASDAYDMDPGLSLAIHNERGSVLTNMKRYREAEADFAEASALASRLGSVPARVIALGNLANVQMLQGRVAAARSTIDIGLPLTRRVDGAIGRGVLLQVAAAAALRGGDLARAEALIGERFRHIALDTTILADRDAHEVAYRVYSAIGDAPRAIGHLAALKRLDDQATEVARSNSAALASARFDYANQELRITKLKAADLQKSVAFERAAARTQRLVFIGAATATALIIALLGIALFTIRRSRDQVRAANADLADSNAALGKALAAKTEFLATTSHEIRTPLNGILGMTQVMIADPALDAAARDRLSVIQGAGVTMRALVDDILDVAKIETGRMSLESAPMDLAATIADACRIWREQARAKGLAFTLDLDSCPGWILGDAARLRQIVFNLLSNAVKFTPAGHVAVRCAAVDGRVVLTVADTGIGIAAEAHEIIFESFRQADAGTTRQFGGTGLGLSICRNLARAMGGEVTVDSALAAGATFTFDLPLLPATAPATVAVDAAVLIVEANPISRAMYKSLFAPEGVVALAKDTVEARDQLSLCRPARILIDLASVGEDLGSLTALIESAREIPALLLAPALSTDARAAWLHMGIADVIERPIGKKELVNRVMTVDSTLVNCAA